jgi:hypothetical protein
MRFMNQIAIALTISLVASFTAQAQVNEKLAGEYGNDIEAARSIVKTERKILIMREMSLTPQQAEAFWPLYDEYVTDRRKVNDLRVNVITTYAANHQKMTNELARELADNSIKWEERKLKLKKKYIKKFRKVLPEIKVVRYFQLESKLDAIINFDLASQIPLME